MKLKKIYIEITNRCNLNCSFCIHNKRTVKDLNYEEFVTIINKIKEHTKEIYLHVLGEPLIHNDILKFIDYANEKELLVNITTNGYLIKKIENTKKIHRLNISLHSYTPKTNITLEQYLNQIFEVVDKIKDKTFISLRVWVENKNTDYIINYINKRYQTNINKIPKESKIKITNNLIIDTFHEFIWPSLDNDYYEEKGTCYGLINHIAILSNGTVVPCCLDSEGIINLGNIFENELSYILNCDRVNNMKLGFKNNEKREELCKHCNFLNK